MIAKSIACVALFLIPGVAFAQSDLTSQINAVNAAVTQEKHDEAATQAAQRARLRERQIKQKREEAREERMAAAARAKKQAKVDRIAAEKRARQAKDEAYHDGLRDLDLRKKKLELQALQTRVGRENDIISQQLKQQAAKTDLIQSNADANRNISEGAKSLLQDTGKARLKDAGAQSK